jgi:hypothetical protein
MVFFSLYRQMLSAFKHAANTFNLLKLIIAEFNSVYQRR